LKNVALWLNIAFVWSSFDLVFIATNSVKISFCCLRILVCFRLQKHWIFINCHFY